MPTTLASTIISKAKILAQDTSAIRWQDAEWLGWLSDGQREVVMLRPNAFTKLGLVQLAPGTKQTLPADAVQFIEFIRNMGPGGTTPGTSARKVPRRMLDSTVPNWHSMAASATVQHYVFEPFAPKNFYAYPPSTGANMVEILYSATPPDVTSLGSVISLDDIYAGPLIDFILFRGYSKDSEFVGNAERALLYRKQFETTLGQKMSADATTVAEMNVRG